MADRKTHFNPTLGRRAALRLGAGALAVGGFEVVTHSSGLSVARRIFSEFGSLENSYEQIQKGIGNRLLADVRNIPDSHPKKQEFKKQASEIWEIVKRPFEPERAYAADPPAVPFAAGQISLEGVFPVILPTLMGAGETLPQDAIDRFFNAQVAPGFKITAIWVASKGVFHGYYPGAPDFVNSQPESLTGLDTQANPPTIVYLIVGKGEKPFVEGISKQMGQAYLAEINAAKRLNGLPEVSVDSRLQTSAEKYARLLYNNPAWFFDSKIDAHALDGEPWDRARREGYPSNIVGEVISYDSVILEFAQEAKRLVDSLLTSPTHRDIVLNKNYAFTDAGVGSFLGNGVVDPKTGRTVLRLVCVADFGHP